MHVHCHQVFRANTQGNEGIRGNFLLSKPVLAPLESGCPKFPKHVLNACIDLCLVVEMVSNIH